MPSELLKFDLWESPTFLPNFFIYRTEMIAFVKMNKILGITLTFLLVACGGDDSGNTADSGSTADSSTVIDAGATSEAQLLGNSVCEKLAECAPAEYPTLQECNSDIVPDLENLDETNFTDAKQMWEACLQISDCQPFIMCILNAEINWENN